MPHTSPHLSSLLSRWLQLIVSMTHIVSFSSYSRATQVAQVVRSVYPTSDQFSPLPPCGII
ncbi:hypothetical protein CPC08DRAFT_703260, partial [Agrocybe pediades]